VKAMVSLTSHPILFGWYLRTRHIQYKYAFDAGNGWPNIIRMVTVDVVRGKRKYQEKYINNCPVPGVPGNFL
jgi:hypothetical protein